MIPPGVRPTTTMPHSSAFAPERAGGSTPMTISAYSAAGAVCRAVAGARSAPASTARRAPPRRSRRKVPAARARGPRSALRCASRKASARKRALSKVEPRVTTASGIVEQLLDEPGWARRRGDHRLRPVAEPQAQHRLIEGVWVAPGGKFVQPQLHMLLAAQPIRLFGRENLADGAVRPFQPIRGAREMRPLVAAGKPQARRTRPHHDVTRVAAGSRRSG